MKVAWTKDCKTGPEKAKRKEVILSNQGSLDILKVIIESKRIKAKGSDYESPSWAYKQADTIGYNRALTELLDLMEFND